MTFKVRIEKLERDAPARDYRDEQYALWAGRLNRARACAGMPTIGELQMKAAPRRAEKLNVADLLRRARLRAKSET
ncbi:hypothetical protein [Hyphomonas sp.]|uniref:hypothetical protein n=1 Tax=Hyphomonas sp. TaxID=87 RepID=UPI0033405590